MNFNNWPYFLLYVSPVNTSGRIRHWSDVIPNIQNSIQITATDYTENRRRIFDASNTQRTYTKKKRSQSRDEGKLFWIIKLHHNIWFCVVDKRPLSKQAPRPNTQSLCHSQYYHILICDFCRSDVQRARFPIYVRPLCEWCGMEKYHNFRTTLFNWIQAKCMPYTHIGGLLKYVWIRNNLLNRIWG